MDLAKITGGSGLLTYRGMTRASKDGINVTPIIETFDIPVDGIGQSVRQRVSARGFEITITDAGDWTRPERCYPYLDWPMGRMIVPVLPVASLNVGTDVLTVSKHRLYVGDRVMLGLAPGATMPTAAVALSEYAFYYVRPLTPDTLTLHTSRADAVAGTNIINFTAAGTGMLKLVAQFDLVIHGTDDIKWTFHSCAITTMPDFNGQRTETPFGAMTFRNYLRNRMRHGQANALYTRSVEAFPGWGSIGLNNLRSQAQGVSWTDLKAIAEIDTSVHTLKSVGHGFASGTAVKWGTTGVNPVTNPVLDPERTYYVAQIDADHVSLHLTAADAVGGNNEVEFQGGGNGVHFLSAINGPWTDMETEAGISISPTMETTPYSVDRAGEINARLTSVSLQATLIPTGAEAEQILDELRMQGDGAELGRDIEGRPLHVYSRGMYWRINNARPFEGPLSWSAANGRVRETVFRSATQIDEGGNLLPVGYVGTGLDATETALVD